MSSITHRMMNVVRPGGAHEERGATAVIVAILATSLLSMGAFTIDYGNASLTRRQTQNAADATARSVVERCAKLAAAAGQAALSGSCVAYSTDEQGIVKGQSNLASDTSTAASPVVGGAGREVTVSVSKQVNYTLARLLGKTDDTVTSSATAEWTNLRPVEGYPVIPFGVAQCTFNQFKPAAGTGDGARTLIRSDTLQTVRSLVNNASDALLNPLLRPLLSLVKASLMPIGTLLDGITGSGAECRDPVTNDVLSLQGGSWLTEAIDLDLVGATCDVNTEIGLILYASSTLHDVLTSRCAAKFGTQIKKGQTILLPIYKPKPVLTNVTGALGLSVNVCGSGVNDSCVKVPPNLGVEIVGYAPFKVTGWQFGSNSSLDPSMPACSSIKISLPLTPLLNALGLGAVVGLVLRILGFEFVDASVGCNGIQGYFTKSFTKDPNFEYGTGGADFGAGLVRIKN